MEIKAIIFDIDGLILDTEKLRITAMKQVASEFDFELSDEICISFLGMKSDVIQKLLNQKYPDLDTKRYFDKSYLRIREIAYSSGITVKEGFFQLINYLKKQNLKIAIASSGSHAMTDEKLKSAKIEKNIFDAICCCDDSSKAKPLPYVYLETCKQLGISPDKTIALEDSEAGLTSAHNAGILPIMIPDILPPNANCKYMAYKILPSLNEVIPLLGSFLSQKTTCSKKN